MSMPSNFLKSFRKYHRRLALVLALPLLLTLVTGVLESLSDAWGLDVGIGHSLLMKIHTGKIFHLTKVYALLNGLGLLGLMITGLSLLPSFRKKSPSATP